jgi:hypothetical protein
MSIVESKYTSKFKSQTDVLKFVERIDGIRRMLPLCTDLIYIIIHSFKLQGHLFNDAVECTAKYGMFDVFKYLHEDKYIRVSISLNDNNTYLYALLNQNPLVPKHKCIEIVQYIEDNNDSINNAELVELGCIKYCDEFIKLNRHIDN